MNPINVSSHDWLNGIIYALGVKKTKYITKIVISNFPCSVIDEIINEFEGDGFSTEIVEEFNSYTRRSDLRLQIAKPGVWMEDMIKISDRRLTFQESKEFLYGYLLTISTPIRCSTLDGVKIHFYMPEDDIKKLVDMFGITTYTIDNSGHLSIKKEDIGDCEPFCTLYDNYALEIAEMEEQYGDKNRELASLLDNLIYENNLGHDSPFAK